MKKNDWQRCLEDHKLTLLGEIGLFFFVVSIIIDDFAGVLFWICIALAAICEILSLVRFFLLIKNKRAVLEEKFPRFLTAWQFLFLGFFYYYRSHDLSRKWMSVGLIVVTVIHIIILLKKTSKHSSSET